MFRQSSGLSAGKYPVPNLDLNYATSAALSGFETFTRASGAWAYNSSGALTQYAANTPRFDHDPVTLTPRGLLLEEQRTNLVSRSSEIDNSAWIKSATTVSANAAMAPDGVVTADKIIETATSGTHYVEMYPIAAAVATVHTVSFFAKAAERSIVSARFGNSAAGGNRLQATWNLSAVTASASNIGNATGAMATILAVGSGWYRCTATVTADTSGSVFYFQIYLGNNTAAYTGDGSSGLFIWGAQVEAGAFPTSYIPTTSTTATRAADVWTISTSAFGYNQNEGTWVAESSAPWESMPGDGARVLLTVGVNPGGFVDSSNCLRIVKNATGSWRYNFRSGGANILNSTANLGSPSDNAAARIAFSYKAGDHAASRGGINLGPFALPNTLPNMQLAAVGLGGAYHFRRIQYFSQRLENAILGRSTS